MEARIKQQEVMRGLYTAIRRPTIAAAGGGGGQAAAAAVKRAHPRMVLLTQPPTQMLPEISILSLHPIVSALPLLFSQRAGTQESRTAFQGPLLPQPALRQPATLSHPA